MNHPDEYQKRLNEMTKHLVTKQAATKVKVPKAPAASYVREFNRINGLKS